MGHIHHIGGNTRNNRACQRNKNNNKESFANQFSVQAEIGIQQAKSSLRPSCFPDDEYKPNWI